MRSLGNRRIFWNLLLLVLLPVSMPAQEKVLSAKAQKLTQAWTALQRSPHDVTVQKRYLEAFPGDFKNFQELFDFHHELYDGADFINVVPSLAKSCEEDVGRLLMNVGKDAHYDADAESYLQGATAMYGSQHTEVFARLLKELPDDKQSQLISFLADVEAQSSYREYQEIIDHLRVLGDTSLALRFEAARQKRSKQAHG